MSGKCTILVVDDDPNDIFFLRRAFEKSGFNDPLLAVSEGQEAVEYLSGMPPFTDRGQYPLPNLLLLDLKMPRMDGFDFLAWFKDSPLSKQLPVVVLTSSSEEDDMAKARSLGARAYNVKPSNFDGLLRLVKQLHSQWVPPASQNGQRLAAP